MTKIFSANEPGCPGLRERDTHRERVRQRERETEREIQIKVTNKV